MRLLEKKTLYDNVPNATNFGFDLGVESGMENTQHKTVDFDALINAVVNEQTHYSSRFIMNVTDCFYKIDS